MASSRYNEIVNALISGNSVALDRAELAASEDFNLHALRVQLYREVAKVDRANWALTGIEPVERRLKTYTDIETGNFMLELVVVDKKTPSFTVIPNSPAGNKSNSSGD